jgi:hypothetical protein
MMKVAGTLSRRCCLPPKLIVTLEEYQLRIIIRMQGVLTIISILLRTYCSILGRSTFSSSSLGLGSLSAKQAQVVIRGAVQRLREIVMIRRYLS